MYAALHVMCRRRFFFVALGYKDAVPTERLAEWMVVCRCYKDVVPTERLAEWMVVCRLYKEIVPTERFSGSARWLLRPFHGNGIFVVMFLFLDTGRRSMGTVSKAPLSKE